MIPGGTCPEAFGVALGTDASTDSALAGGPWDSGAPEGVAVGDGSRSTLHVCGVWLELYRPSGFSGLAGRMPVPRVDVPPAPSNSGAESAPLAVPLMHLDLSASALTVSLVAVVDRATLIHVHL